MFSAAKFVVAGAIVALFGGFLLAGVLTQPSEEAVPAVGASPSAPADTEPSQPPETSQREVSALDIRKLEWAPLDLDEATFGPRARLVAVAASDSMVVVGGSVDGSAAVWTSTDRMNWDRVPHDEGVFGGPADQEIKAIVPWRHGFVAAGEVGGVSDFGALRVAAVWVSEDGTSWSRIPHDEEVFGGVGRQEMFDIAATDDRLVIVGFDEEVAGTTNEDIAVWTSTDGFEWTQQTFGGGEMFAVEGTPEGFVGVGHGGLWRSADGVRWEWSEPRDLRLAWMPGLAQTPSGFVAVGSSAGDRPAAWTSADGVTWAPATIDAPPFGDAEWWGPNDVAFADSGLAASAGPGISGGESTILVSADGETWTLGNTSVDVADACLGAIASFGPHFIAIGPGSSRCGAPSSIWTTFEPRPSTRDVERAPDTATDGPGKFSPSGSLAQGRVNHTATLLPDDRVLIMGGDTSDGPSLATAEVWDPETESFESFGAASSRAQAHGRARSTLLPDGRVLIVVSGQTDDGDAFASAEVWDPATATLRPAGSLTPARFGHTSTLLPDGRVLIVGGYGDQGDVASAEVWDPATASFEAAGSLAQWRYAHTATLLPDGRVLIVGGDRLPGCDAGCALAQVWDPATATFEPAGSLAQERENHTTTLLPDGRVLVVGGRAYVEPGEPAVIASTEVSDPATASFGPGGSLADARYGHTATLLPDGRVLVVGGSEDFEDGFLATAEIWTPTDASASAAKSPPDLEPPDADAPTTTPDLLPGVDLVTEEIKPGVYRVFEDGAGHDLQAGIRALATVDDSVWVETRRVFELGRPGTYPSTRTGFIAPSADGSLWAATGDGRSLRSFDGGAWTNHDDYSDADGSASDPWWPPDYIGGFAVHPDGTVWRIAANGGDDAHTRLQRLGPGSWVTYRIGEELPMLGCSSACGEGWSIEITPDGTVWLGVEDGGLLQFDGGDWKVVRPVGGEEDHGVVGLASNGDGILWAELQAHVVGSDRPSPGAERHLARFDGLEWEVFRYATEREPGLGGIRAVGSDGAVWLTDSYRELDHAGRTDDPVMDIKHTSLPVSYDGERWRRYPAVLVDLASDPLNQSVDYLLGTGDIAVGPDGTAWVTVDAWGGTSGLYVITTEAAEAE